MQTVMKCKVRSLVVCCVAVGLVLVMLVASRAQGQISSERLATIRSQLNQTKTVAGQLPKGVLSSHLQNTLQLAAHLDGVSESLQSMENTQIENLKQQAAIADTISGRPSSRGVPVNNPRTDFLYSLLGGFTQYETSTAWCGNNVVVGFADSGSILESLLFGAGGLSSTGSAFSTDGGRSFVDSGFINPGANTANQLQGNGVVSCASENTFFYTQIFATGTASQPIASVAFSKSTDGGKTWAEPIPAVSLDARAHVTDKPWSTVDPHNPDNIYVTYTDFDVSNTVCSTSPRSAIELVHSNDRGNTWSAPIVVDQYCAIAPQNPVVQGSQVEVDSHGVVYGTWEAYTSTSPPMTRAMRLAKSVDHGASFTPFVKIDDITPVGIADSTGFYSPIFPVLQGNIQDYEWPTLAIDRSGTPTDGILYVLWNDGRFLTVPDLLSLTGNYGYSNIVLSRSTDGGKTWSPATRVNSNPIVLRNDRGTDQFQPAAAVDPTGAVAVCWFDRSADPNNYLIGRTCGISTNQGSNWSNAVVTSAHWPPIKATDLFDTGGTFGDYNQLTSDFLTLHSGFMGAYNAVTTSGVLVPNQDVFLITLPKGE